MVALAGMQAKAVEFFAYCEAGNAEPAGRLGLVTMGELDRLGEKLTLGGFDKRGVGVLELTAAGGGEQLGDAASQRLSGDQRGRASAGTGRFVQTDRVAAPHEQRPTHDVLQFAHVAGPRLLLEKTERFGMDRRPLDPQLRTISGEEILTVSGMSSGRFRSGGSSMTTTLSRKNRSSRNCFFRIAASRSRYVAARTPHRSAGRRGRRDAGSTFPAARAAASPVKQLKQVLINLVQNAAEALGTGGTIKLRAVESRIALGGRMRDVAIIEVEDNGTGMPPEVQKRLFDPFFTTKPTGTGLGLSIAARIVEKHAGALRVKTAANHGTTFGVVLPVEP